MAKNLALAVTIILFAFSNLAAEKLATLPGLLSPDTMAVDDERIYVTEGATVFIYSLKDYRLIKKFGQRGEGPAEFPTLPGLPLIVRSEEDHLLINSANRISFFSKDGQFIKMVKSKGGTLFSGIFQPIKDKFVGLGVTAEDETLYNCVNLHDSKLYKIKILAKVKRSAQQTGPIKVFSDNLGFQTYKDRIFLLASQDFVIDILDIDGNKINTIKRDYERVPFTDNDKEEIFAAIKANPQQRQFFEVLKQRMVFPKYFPAVVNIFVADDLLHLVTWKRDKDRFEFFIYDCDGKFIKKMFVGFRMREALQPFPAAFNNRKVYQLIENEDEEWELHASNLE
jgi:hypothetical protein